MQKYFHRTDWTKGVNQGAALHLAELMMKEGHNPDDSPKSSIKVDQHSDDGKSSNKGSNKLQVPMFNGAPIPHDGDPFIRLQKKTKRDIKSRTALIRMLKHEKAEVAYQKHMQRFNQFDDYSCGSGYFGQSNEKDQSKRLHLIEELHEESLHSSLKLDSTGFKAITISKPVTHNEYPENPNVKL